ncbi:MAG TPA: hypothetical protein VLF20_03815 [Patescibacteria group bacterium]|nr:hypothetical protein [Patescibacteria group bacterium]
MKKLFITVIIGFILFIVIIVGSIVVPFFLNSIALSGDYKPITQAIEQQGGRLLCDQKGGDGVDSNPWYKVFYEIADSPELSNQIKTFAKQKEYILETDTRALTRYGKDITNTKTDYLYALKKQPFNKPESHLDVTIVRDEEVVINCANRRGNSRQMTPQPGQAIIKLYFY